MTSVDSLRADEMDPDLSNDWGSGSHRTYRRKPKVDEQRRTVRRFLPSGAVFPSAGSPRPASSTFYALQTTLYATLHGPSRRTLADSVNRVSSTTKLAN